MRLDPVAFLGPTGTFTEEALMSQPDLADATHVPMTGVFEIVKAIESGDVACGVVPIENSIEGSVNATLGALAFDTLDVYIEREVVLGVDLNLVGIPSGHRIGICGTESPSCDSSMQALSLRENPRSRSDRNDLDRRCRTSGCRNGRPAPGGDRDQACRLFVWS